MDVSAGVALDMDSIDRRQEMRALKLPDEVLDVPCPVLSKIRPMLCRCGVRAESHASAVMLARNRRGQRGTECFGARAVFGRVAIVGA
jgi:hypothetical protein